MKDAHCRKTILDSSIRELLPGRLANSSLASLLRRYGRIGVFSLVSVAAAISAHGQAGGVATWNGGGATSNFSDFNNWVGTNSPIDTSPGSQIHFAGGMTLSPNNDLTGAQALTGANAANSITFDSNANSFTVGGNLITLTGGITNNNFNNQTLNLPIQLSGSQTFNGGNGSSGNGGLTFGGTINLSGNALTLAGSAPITFNSAITDSAGSNGSLTVSAAAAFLNGANTFTGGTTVTSQAVLVVNGSLKGPVTVNSGGILSGNGIVGNLTNNGLVIPIGGLNSTIASNLQTFATVQSFSLSLPGFTVPAFNFLQVNGNYTQTHQGFLAIVQGNSQFSGLAVRGTASLGGTLIVAQLNNFQLTKGQMIPIITAAGGITGQFDQSLVAPQLGADLEQVGLNIDLVGNGHPGTGSSFLQGALTIAQLSGTTVPSNYFAVAKGLDAAANDSRAAGLFHTLNSETLSQLFNSVGNIDPDVYTSVNGVGASTGGSQVNSVGARMTAVQSGAGGAGNMASGFSSNISAGYAGPSGPDGKGGKEVMPPPADNRWGSFITGAGEFERVGDTQVARGFNEGTGSVTVGVDYRFTDHFVAGIFGGYTYAGINIATGRIAVDTGKGGLYATYFDGGFYVNSAVEGGYDGYSVTHAGVGAPVHSSPTGGDFNLLLAPGYNWTSGGFTFGPTSRFQYAYTGTDAFTESGGLAPLSVGSEHSTSLVSGFGLKASYDWKVGSAIIRPELRLEWEHEYGDVTTDVTSRLASGAGNAFTVSSPAIGRDDFHVGAGFAVVFSDRLNAYVYYDGQFFRTNYDSSSVTGGFRFLF